MSERAHLPEFVTEALEADEGSLPPLVDGAVARVEGAGPAGSGRAGAAQASGGLASGGSGSSGPGQGVGPGVIGPLQLDDIERCFGALLEAAWPDGATPAGAASSLAGAAGGLEVSAPSAALFERLQATIDEPPYRYAPFFARAAELFDLPEPAVIEELARLADPKVWRFAGLPGIHHAAIKGGPRVMSAETLFVRFSPGVRFPKHRHTGLERVLVLEGSYRDSMGVVHRAGELRDWAEGTEHGFVVDPSETCIFASVVFGRRFSAWPLRALASVLGR